ncbi:MAG: DivIVA domain-containing protein [Clostridiales bacterium]|nr:DivIVA domain-containing protein [Clostridia bacterium]MCR4882585.1 DivIVA domain-containing protein [Clostridiales bacterium]
MQQITIEAIESKEFSISKNGYNQDEVDGFLDDICDEMERQLATINKLQQQLREAQTAAARPVSVPVAAPISAQSEASFREILEMAQKVKDETISNAQKQAEAILQDAKAKAEAQLGDLSAERDRLTAQVDSLKKTVTTYRTDFEALLASQKEALSKIANL